MGRRKISIQPITDERNRKVTFVKRKAGLFKKAHELAVLCQVDLAVVILGHNNSKFYEYSSVNLEDLLNAHSQKGYSHEFKTPADYGDYDLISRVQGANTQAKGHKKNYSSVSVSIDGVSSGDEDDDDEEDEEEEEPEVLPQSKRKRATVKKEKSQPAKEGLPTSHQTTLQQPLLAEPQQGQRPSLPAQMFNVYNSGPPIIQHQQPLMYQQQHMQQPHQAQTSYQYQQLRPPLEASFTQSHQEKFQPGQNSPEVMDENTVPVSRRNYQLQQPVSSYQYPAFQFSPATPSSQRSEVLPTLETPPVVPKSINNHSTQYDSARARSLNSNISKRPILRVQIPEDPGLHPPKPAIVNGQQSSDSAVTVTAVDTSNQPASDKDETNPRSGSSSHEVNSADGSKPSIPGVSPVKSTPVSATVPSRLFALPHPHQNLQSSQHQQYQQNFKTLVGEQTPLTGGLPSKYVPDLFPSPSNFYSSEWNIPFGSGSTPYPNSANAHQLPNVNTNINGPNGNGPPRLTKLPSLNAEFTDSPLQHFSKDTLKDPKQNTTGKDNTSTTKKIEFKKEE